LLQEVLQRQLAAHDLGRGLFRLLGVPMLLGLLDQRQHVAHAEDPTGHPVGVEDVEVLELLTGRREQDGRSGHLPDAERGTAAGIAVELGQYDTGEADTLGEGLRGGHRVLADHRVDNEEDLVGIGRRAHIRGLPHQLVVDAESAGGVDDDRVEVAGAGVFDAAARDLDRVAGGDPHLPFAAHTGTRLGGVHRHAGPFADDLQLIDGPGALEVARHEKGGVTLLSEPRSELARQRGLTGTLQAGKHDHRGRCLGQCDPAGLATEDADELLIDDLDHLLRRIERTGDFRTLRPRLDAVDERPHDGQGDVGFQECEPDLAGRRVDIGISQAAFAAQVFERTGQPVGQRVKHGVQSFTFRWRSPPRRARRLRAARRPRPPARR